MAHLVVDRSLTGNVANTWPRWEEMLGKGAASGFVGTPRPGVARAGIAGQPVVEGQSGVAGQSAAAAQSSTASTFTSPLSTGPAGVKPK